MTNLRIGIQTLSLRQPLRRALETAGRMRADGVQLDLRHELPLADCSATALREIRKLLGDYRLRVSSVAFPTRRGLGDEADLDRRLAAMSQAMSVASQLGTKSVVIRVGQGIEAENRLRPRVIESLTLLGRHSDHVGVQLAAQTSATRPEELVSLIGDLPEGTLGVDYHPAELMKHGHSPLEALRTLGPHVLHVTAADAVHDLADRRVVDVALGRGTVDFPEVLAALDGNAYEGWITVERRGASDSAGELEDAVEYLRAVQRG